MSCWRLEILHFYFKITTTNFIKMLAFVLAGLSMAGTQPLVCTHSENLPAALIDRNGMYVLRVLSMQAI